VPASDYRVAEVRLLDDAGVVGDCGQGPRARDNLLIRGDALHALTSLSELPEFARELVGRVKLAYIDPPFNTQQTFPQYDDALEHSVWLTMMRDRLLTIRKLLRPDGSVWVHCNDDEQHRLRCVLDEVFGESAFIATIVWQGRYSRDSRPAIGPVHHFIHVYAPMGTAWKGVRNRIHREDLKWRNPDNDPNGEWVDEPFQAQAGRATINQFYGVRLPNGTYVPPPDQRAWAMPQHRYEQLLEENPHRFWFGAKGESRPRIKRYRELEEKQGLVPWTWWPHDEVGHSEEAFDEVTALVPDAPTFSTPKPERLLERIITVASDPGDIVLDCFAGSGTTAAVAHKMRRRWITVERNAETLDRYVLPRLNQVVHGQDPGGATLMSGWAGGGGFRLLDVAP
jgi:adenine-specific DNA-methyltransferase